MKSNLLISFSSSVIAISVNLQVTKVFSYFFLLRALWFSLLCSGFARDPLQIRFFVDGMRWGQVSFFSI